MGLDVPTADAIIVTQGITDMETLVSFLQEAQVKDIARSVRYGYQTPAVPAVPPVPGPFVTAVAATKFHAVWYWGILRLRCGRELTANNNTLSAAEIKKTLDRIRFEAQVKEVAESGEAKKPPPLKKVEKFHEWFDSWNTYMHSMRGAARLPLPYVYRKVELATDAMRIAVYDTTDEEYMALFGLTGSYYAVDNAKVFNELMQYVIGGPCESIVKPFRRKNDGRGAVLALLKYANGDDAQERRAAHAYSVIESTVYKRMSKAFSLDDFFARLRDAYAILSHADINQPVQEQRKWQDTLDKIEDSSLESAKMALRTAATPDKTFEGLASKMKELAHEIYKSRKTKGERLIGATGAEKQAVIKDGTLHGGNYTNADWAKLTSEQQGKVRDLRKAAKNRKRAIKSAGTSDQTKSVSDEEASDEPSGKAGTQFGRNAHKKKK